MTPLSLWNAAAGGLAAADVLAALDRHTRYPVPPNVATEIREQIGRYGRVRLEKDGAAYAIECADVPLAEEIWNYKELRPLFSGRPSPTRLAVPAGSRGLVKRDWGDFCSCWGGVLRLR